MNINTHGRKINLETLTNASDSTKGLGSRTGEYMEIFYDKSTGDVWGKYHCHPLQDPAADRGHDRGNLGRGRTL